MSCSGSESWSAVGQRGGVKSVRLRGWTKWKGEPKTQIFAENRRFRRFAPSPGNRCVPPCAAKTYVVRPVFARVVRELWAADPSECPRKGASPEAQSEAPS